jgi:hypothetical protein
MGTPGVKSTPLLALLLLAACASPAPGPSTAAAPSTPAASTSPPPATPEVSPAADQCGATALQYLVGKPETEIPIAIDPTHRRVVCTTCPMTRDYRLDRQTILFDEKTQLVTSVACN